MQKYTNNTGLSLFAQVFLATDYYDYEQAGLSATTLLKPIKQTILGARVPEELRVVDVQDMAENRVGAAIHDGFERAWNNPHLVEVLKSLNVPAGLAGKVRVNPTPEEVAKGGIIPVYMEQRLSKEVRGHRITGKFDAVINGEVEDLKTTKVWKYINSKDEDYIWQGSIYRWLGPHIITKDHMNLTFSFTDYKKSEASYVPNYPPSRMLTKRLPLKSMEETEAFVTRKVDDLIRLKDVHEDQLPPCDDNALWRKPTQWRYYKNADKAYMPGSRSTKNFDDLMSAMNQYHKDGSVGVVIEKKGEVLACKWCKAFPICRQKDALIASGDLIV